MVNPITHPALVDAAIEGFLRRHPAPHASLMQASATA